MSPQPSGDLTPSSGSPTDVAPLGRSTPPPAHEQSAAASVGKAKWDAIEADPDFKKLLADKLRFIIPGTIFFMVYYFTLPILVGWWPELMKTKILGEVNLAYLFALSQFFMSWAVAFVYIKVAAGWDKQSAALLAKFNKH